MKKNLGRRLTERDDVGTQWFLRSFNPFAPLLLVQEFLQRALVLVFKFLERASDAHFAT
jgi:hypothetical protein